jgi:hypothetical protein
VGEIKQRWRINPTRTVFCETERMHLERRNDRFPFSFFMVRRLNVSEAAASSVCADAAAWSLGRPQVEKQPPAHSEKWLKTSRESRLTSGNRVA